MRIHSPGVSFLYRLRLDPRRNRKFKRVRNHISLWFLYSLISWVLIIGLLLPIHDWVVHAARTEARAEALIEFESTHKERLRSDQAYLGKACHTWWFDMTHQDRTLDIPKKGKRK